MAGFGACGKSVPSEAAVGMPRRGESAQSYS